MAFRFAFPLPRWNRLQWRQKSVLLACAACGLGIVVAIALVGLWQLENASLRNWFSLTFVPFVFIVLLGGMARVQHKIDMRAGREATEILESIDP